MRNDENQMHQQSSQKQTKEKKTSHSIKTPSIELPKGGEDVPGIQRKTDGKFSGCRDGLESDTFIFSGREDMVPELVKYADDNWCKNIVIGEDAIITFYRPRIEGTFVRIEKVEENSNVYWRVRTKENVVSVFGKSDTAKLFDSGTEGKNRVFKWCLEYTYDDKGNFTQYYYKKESKDNIGFSLSDKNRLNNIAAFTNTYLKGIKYGNVKPYYEGDSLPTDFLFELVFEHGLLIAGCMLCSQK